MNDVDLGESFVDVGRASIYKESSSKATSIPTPAQRDISEEKIEEEAKESSSVSIPQQRNSDQYRDHQSEDDNGEEDDDSNDVLSMSKLTQQQVRRQKSGSFSSGTTTTTSTVLPSTTTRSSASIRMKSRNVISGTRSDSINSNSSGSPNSKRRGTTTRNSKYAGRGSTTTARTSYIPGGRWSSATEGPLNTADDDSDSCSDVAKSSVVYNNNTVYRRKSKQQSKQSKHQEQQTPSSPPPPSDSIVTFIIKSTFKAIGSITRLIFSPLQDALSTFCLIILLLIGAYFGFRYLIAQPLSAALGHLSIIPTVPSLSVALTGVGKYAWCGTIGIGCGDSPSLKRGKLVRKVSGGVQTTLDIFQTLANMGAPNQLGLHHVEIWELSVAVRHSSQLETRITLADSIYELGYEMRNVKDSMVRINSLGVNTFSWTLREFARLERMLSSPFYTENDISKSLDIFFERLDGDLSTLLQHIEAAIPEADKAAHLGLQIKGYLTQEGTRLLREKEDTPLWRALLNHNTSKGKQLARDLELTQMSVANVQDAHRKLENARETLLHYRDTTGLFKAGLLGYHLSDMNLRPDDEILALRSIMGEFSDAVNKAKVGTSLGAQHAEVGSGGGGHDRGNLLLPRSYEFDRVGGSADE